MATLRVSTDPQIDAVEGIRFLVEWISQCSMPQVFQLLGIVTIRLGDARPSA